MERSSIFRSLHGLFFLNLKWKEVICVHLNYTFFNGKILLAGLLRKGETYVERAIRFQDAYEVHKKRKSSGGTRLISVPHPTLREFQRRFLRYFLYRIWQQGWISPHLFGFLPQRSAVMNARWHARSDAKYVVRLDIKDAFPSVTADEVQKILSQIVTTEILRYRLAAVSQVNEKGHRGYPRPPLFSTRKKVKWFRKLFMPGPKPKWLRNVDPYEVLDQFFMILMPLITYQGVLPQGAPTSPFLLNLALSHYGIPQTAYEFFQSRGTAVQLSVYADDFTISSKTEITADQIEEFMSLVEGQQSIFHFNREKTVFFNRRHIAPLVTGLRLVTVAESPWRPAVETVRVPKKEIRKIRGIIHQAIFDVNLRVKARGYIDYLRDVYGTKLPSQVARPWQKLCEVMK